MELFAVNRCDEPEKNSTKTEEEKKLAKLLKKVNKRKNVTSTIEKTEIQKQEVENLENNEEEDKHVKEKKLKLTTTKQKKRKKTDDNLIKKKNEIDFQEVESETEENSNKKETKTVNLEGFTILGSNQGKNVQSVKRILPKWLRNPTVISSNLTDLNTKISEVNNLNKRLKKNLKQKEIKLLFPVQKTFIPWMLNSTQLSKITSQPDACVSAPTGSGKTLSFVLPLLQTLLNNQEQRISCTKHIRALIVLPTQNLALQIFQTIKYYSEDTNVNVGIAVGAGNKNLEVERAKLMCYNSIWGAYSKVDILVCTPGRLIDHLKFTKGFDLSGLEYLIVDEADRVLDFSFVDWLYHLEMHIKNNNSNLLNVNTMKSRNNPQKLLFSATLSHDPEKLQKLLLFQPKLFTSVSSDKQIVTENNDDNNENLIDKFVMPRELTEKYVVTSIETKPLILYTVIKQQLKNNSKSRILIFTNTIETLHRLNMLINYMSEQMFRVFEISSANKNLEERKLILKKFEAGSIQIIASTDNLARGIDIPNVDLVISYSRPKYLKTYIHRAGRTARAGMQGTCISILTKREASRFFKMTQNIRSVESIEEIEMSEDDIQNAVPLFEKSLQQLKERISNETEETAKVERINKRLQFSRKRKRNDSISKSNN